MVKYALTILLKAIALLLLVGVISAVAPIALGLLWFYTYGFGVYALALIGAVCLTAAAADASLRTCRRIRTRS